MCLRDTWLSWWIQLILNWDLTFVFFFQLRSVALRYLNCNMTILDSIDATRFAIKQFRALGHRCRPADGSKTSPHVPFTKHCCLSLDACDACVHYHLEHPRSVSACTLVQVLDGVRTVHSDHRSCVELTNNYNGAEFYTNCCEGLAQNYTSNTVSFNFGSKTVSSRNVLHITTPDKFVSESSMRVMCKRLKLSRNVMGEKWNMNLSYRLELAGLGCRTNRTVRFYAMDMSSHYGSAFSASILGDEIDQTLSGKRTSPSAVILDIAVLFINQIIYLFNLVCCSVHSHLLTLHVDIFVEVRWWIFLRWFYYS